MHLKLYHRQNKMNEFYLEDRKIIKINIKITIAQEMSLVGPQSIFPSKK